MVWLVARQTMAGVTTPSYGLSAFIQMAAEQRLEQFERLVGGRRVLHGVNKTLDSRWISASNTKL